MKNTLKISTFLDTWQSISMQSLGKNIGTLKDFENTPEIPYSNLKVTFNKDICIWNENGISETYPCIFISSFAILLTIRGNFKRDLSIHEISPNKLIIWGYIDQLKNSNNSILKKLTFKRVK